MLAMNPLEMMVPVFEEFDSAPNGRGGGQAVCDCVAAGRCFGRAGYSALA